MVSHLCCSLFMGLGLKSDGHGNGGTLINGNGGTLLSFCLNSGNHYTLYQLFASIYVFKYILETVEHIFTGFKGFIAGLKSDGLSCYGGTHYHLSIQAIIIHHTSCFHQ